MLHAEVPLALTADMQAAARGSQVDRRRDDEVQRKSSLPRERVSPGMGHGFTESEPEKPKPIDGCCNG